MLLNVNSYDLKKLIEAGIVKDVLPLPKENPLYIVGDYYWCGYWQKYYQVLHAHYEPHRDEKCKLFHRMKSVTVKWQDGSVGTHRTSLDPMRDYRLIMGKGNAEKSVKVHFEIYQPIAAALLNAALMAMEKRKPLPSEYYYQACAADMKIRENGKTSEVLDALFSIFNAADRPVREMHSLSVGDIIVLTRSGNVTTWLVCSVGFEQIKNIFAPKAK